ncbi:MAG: hypothetical protein HY360_17525 [Verrucomicrobia bacterium]|nr:hypothetical protein [Verrucomicrobiota bacterium]
MAPGFVRADDAHPTQPLEEKGNTPVLWLESDRVHSAWEGGNLKRVTDEENKTSCLEWFEDPATKAEAKLALTGLDPSRYDALCLEWKYMGGGSGLTVQAGKRNWYLFKEKYEPNVWHEAWLDLSLDDDMLGTSPGYGPRTPSKDKEELAVILKFANFVLNRPDEQSWRRIRVKNIRLVKFPVKLNCDPKRVAHIADDMFLHTRFPLMLTNTTAQAQAVKLTVVPQRLRDFSYAFETERLTLKPGEQKTVPLTFTTSREKVAKHPPLYIEETPVYATVEGDPNSRTTWYRGYVQWMPGGVVPPPALKRPFMTKAGTKERVLERVQAYPWAKAIFDNWVKTADGMATNNWVAPELRYGYPSDKVCPEHKTHLEFDLVNFKRHFCASGKHFIEGNEALDREAAIRVHLRNSEQCRQLGWAYYLTNDERYARKAAELLLAYAARFPAWEYADARSTGYSCRVGHGVLGECWWAHGFILGYDLIAAAPSLTDAQRQKIETDLFLLEADDIQNHRVQYNQQAEINSASGEAAINARNWYLAARAFTGSYGLIKYQVDEAFSEEGFSLENDIAYHFAALIPIQEQGLVYEALGGAFFTPRVKRIYDAPLVFTVNPGIAWNPAFYEVAYAHYQDPAYLPILAGARVNGGNAETLIEGAIPLPTTKAPGEFSSSSLELAGRTVLRKGGVNDLRGVQIFWGSPTWRGGKDFLNFLVSFQGAVLNTSVTRVSYGNPKSAQALSYSTLGGNVPEVDGLTQSGVRPKQVAFRDGEWPVAKYVAPPNASPYPGVGLSRVIAIINDVFVVADRLTADKPRRLSVSFYPGVMAFSITPALTFAPNEAFIRGGETYAKIRSPERATCGKAFALDYKSGDFLTRAHFLLDGDGELIKGVTYSGWEPVDTPVLLVRRQASAMACVLALEAGKDKLPIQDLKVLPVTVNDRAAPMDQGLAVSITLATGVYVLIDCDLPGTKKAAGIETPDNLWVGKAK